MCNFKTTVRYFFNLFFAGSMLLSFNAFAQKDWKQMANFPGAARDVVSYFAIGNYGYIGVGYTGSFVNDFYKWDQLTNTWSAIANYPGAGQFGCSCFAIENKGYVGLGQNASLTSSNDLWRYDPIANTWTAMAPFPGPNCYSSTTFVLGHKAWFVCYSTGGPPYYPQVWMYDAHTNSWTHKSNYPGGSNEGLVAFAIGNRGYAGCGWDGSSLHNNMYQYDTTSDTWTPIAPFPGAGTGLGGGAQQTFVIGSKAYVLYGQTSSVNALPVAWIYDTVTKGWCAFSHLDKIARAYAASFTINNKLYMGVGTDTNSNISGPYVNDFWEYDPLASIAISDTNLCTSPSVNFSGITTMDTTESVNWSWSFPGGTPATSTSQYPTVTYPVGTYTVQLIVSNCATSDTVKRVIQVIGNTSFPIILKGNTSICNGQTDTLSASGGSSYAWSTGATTSSIIVNPPSTTTYTVHVTNGACARDTTVTVNVGAKLNVVINGKSPVCAGSPLTLTATGGTGYTYLWNNGATTSTITVTPTMNTTYSVVVSNGVCNGDTNLSIVVIPVPKLTLTSTTTALCKGDSATLTVGGASSYVWSTGATTTSITVAPTTTTTYSVQGSNGTCTADTTIKIVVNITPVAVVTGLMNLCYGTSTTLTASGGEEYKWIPSAGISCDSCATVTANPGSTTTYSVIVKNGNCADTAVEKVTVSPKPVGSVCCSDTIQMGDTAIIRALDSNAITYYWTPNTALNCTTCPVVQASPQFSTTYTAVMMDSSGCIITDSVRIYVEGCDKVYIPNVFTPNGDGLNDVFKPEGICMVAYTMYIFDRWGELLYYTDASKPWNGTIKGSNTIVPEDTYVYKIVETDGFLKTHTIIGRVTVLK